MATAISIKDFSLWERMEKKRIPFGFDIEVTARCNFRCRHCYINLLPDDTVAKESEMTTSEILDIGRQAVDLGALWCVLTGGEPLLRNDFEDIYIGLKRLGLIVSIYTNAALVKDRHVALWKKYPPKLIEITMYGASPETYERVTGRSGSLEAFKAGLERILSSGMKVRLKAMALRSNLSEHEAIAEFCRKHTKDYYKFDPILHLRMDRNEERNKEIIAERLTPAEIVALERADPERAASMDKHCNYFIFSEHELPNYNKCKECLERNFCYDYEKFTRLLYCSAGQTTFSVSYDGTFRLCQSLNAPGTTYDLLIGTLHEAWEEFVPHVRQMKATSEKLMLKCKSCPIVNLCLNCAAHAWLESGDCEAVVEYFCDVAHARQKGIGKKLCFESCYDFYS